MILYYNIMSSKTKNIITEFPISSENTPLLNWYASILCRLAYDPPMLYQLGLIEVRDILKSQGYLDPIVNQIYDASYAPDQEAFINVLKDTTTMKPLSLISNEINEKLDTLKKNVYSKQGIPEPQKPDPEDTELSGGAKKMTLDNLSSENLKKIKDSSEDNIRTIFIQTNHDENLYITADRLTNSIYVTFRGTQSIKNSLSDANIVPYKGCDGNLLDESKTGGFSLKSIKASAQRMSKKAKDKASSMKKSMNNKFKSTEIKYFGGVASLVTSTINTVMYSIVHLCKTFLHSDSPPDAAGQVQVFCFGHSLGGGLTTYFSWLFPGAYNKFTDDEKKYLKPSVICISNAAPRILNLMTMNKYVDMMKQGLVKYLRQWTKGDWVAKVPPQLTGYYHPKDSSLTTTFETAKYWSTSGLKRNPKIPLDGKFGASTGRLGTSTSLSAHCWQQYIDFWPVVKGFTIGSDQTSKKEANNSGEKVVGKKITVNLVLIGESESVVKSINKNIGIESIDSREDNPKKKPLSLKIDSQVTDYQWYLSNIINTLSDDNVSVKETPLESVENVPDAKSYNFATGTCSMYQKGITADSDTADPQAIINQKGGSVNCHGEGDWRGINESGRADAAFFNFLELGCKNYWDLWKYPLIDEGIMNSASWTEENKDDILRLLENINEVRTRGVMDALNRGARDNQEDRDALRDAHTKVLAYVRQLKNLIEKNGINFHNELNQWDENEETGEFDISDTEGFSGISSEIQNMANPSSELDRYAGGGQQYNIHDTELVNNKRKRKSRKKRRRKRTRKNKRKYRKSKSKRLPKLTRRTPYKKYS